MRNQSAEYGPYESIIRKLAIRPRMRQLSVPALSHACAEELVEQLESLEVSLLSITAFVSWLIQEDNQVSKWIDEDRDWL